MTDTATAEIGDNKPPIYDAEAVEKLQSQLANFGATAKEWVDLGALTDPQQASNLVDFIAGCRQFGESADKFRKRDKQPHLDAGKTVDNAYRSLSSGLEKLLATVEPISRVWLQKEQRRLDREKEEREAEAAREFKQAQDLEHQAQARGDLLGVADAEDAQAEAEKEVKAAAKPVRAKSSSASGAVKVATLRKTKVVKITNLRVAFLHFQNHPKIMTAVHDVASAHVRAADWDGKPIPGVEVTTQEKAV